MVRIRLPNVIILVGLCIVESLSDDVPYRIIEKAYYDSYTFEQAKNYTAAMNAMSPVLTRYENGYTVNFRMGWLSYLNGKYADALRYYKKSLVVYPASIEVLNCVSLVYKAMDDWAKVEEQNYQILKIDYFNTTANYWYAVALKKRKKYEQAENVCRKMLTVFPTSVTFLLELGEILYNMKKKDEALSMFSSVKILDPQNNSAQKFIELISSSSKRK